MVTNSIVVLGYYFNEKLALANGIGLSGGTLGILILAPLIRYLNDEYSWRGAMLICGGMLGNVCVVTSLYRLSQAEVKSMTGIRPEVKNLPLNTRKNCGKDINIDEEDKAASVIDGYYSNIPSPNCESCPSNKNNLRRHLRAFVRSYTRVLSIRFVMTGVVSVTFHGFSYFAALMYFVSNAIDLGIPKTEAAFLLSIFGICGTVGRLFYGPVIDKNIMSPFYFGSLLLGISGSSCLLGALARSYVALAIFAAVLGFSSCTYHAMYPLLLRDVVGVNNFKKMFGVTVILMHVATIAALPLMGKNAVFILLVSLNSIIVLRALVAIVNGI